MNEKQWTSQGQNLAARGEGMALAAHEGWGALVQLAAAPPEPGVGDVDDPGEGGGGLGGS